MVKFVNNGADIIKSLKERVEAGDNIGIERIAHMLKGAAGNLGLDDIAKEAESIELAARTGEKIDYFGEIDKLYRLIRIIEEEMNR